MAKATGLGGVFLKAQDPQALATWYATHLGIQKSDDGSMIFDGPDAAGMTVFALFPAASKYFGDGPQQSMLNFRVDDMDALLAQLAEAGVRVDPKRQDESYGRFAWIWDPDGNRVELWEPPAGDGVRKDDASFKGLIAGKPAPTRDRWPVRTVTATPSHLPRNPLSASVAPV